MITDLQGILAEHPFLKGLNPEYVKLVTGCASNVRFSKGDVLFRTGEEANTFYIIRSGTVALDLFGAERGNLTIQTLSAGDVLGWSWLFPPYRWHFDARAIEAVRAIALDGKCLRGKCEADPALGFELVKRMAHVLIERLQTTRLQLIDVYGSKGK